MVSSLFSLGGSAVSKIAEKGKDFGMAIAEKVIKPKAIDIKDGYKTSTLLKHNLFGSLDETLAKTSDKLNKLSDQLNTQLKGSTNKVNILNVLEETQNSLNKVKAKNVGNLKQIDNVLKNLTDDIINVVDDAGNTSVVDAQAIKQGVGKKGAWQFGFKDPDATAREVVYNEFYKNARKAIEDAIPEGNIKEINKQISELIPVQHAVIRRLPVENRANVLSLTDSIGLFASIFNPKALILTGAQTLSKSGKFAKFLVDAADMVKNLEQGSEFGKRILQ
jgi:hypothetical protein